QLCRAGCGMERLCREGTTLVQPLDYNAIATGALCFVQRLIGQLNGSARRTIDHRNHYRDPDADRLASPGRTVSASVRGSFDRDSRTLSDILDSGARQVVEDDCELLSPISCRRVERSTRETFQHLCHSTE